MSSHPCREIKPVQCIVIFLFLLFFYCDPWSSQRRLPTVSNSRPGVSGLLRPVSLQKEEIERSSQPLTLSTEAAPYHLPFFPQSNLKVFFLNLNHVCEYVCLVSNCLSPLCDCRFLRAAGWPGDLIGWWRAHADRWLLVLVGGGWWWRKREVERERGIKWQVCMSACSLITKAFWDTRGRREGRR